MTMIDHARADAQANNEMPPCPKWCELAPGHDPYRSGYGRFHTRKFGGVRVEEFEMGDEDFPTAIGAHEWAEILGYGYSIDAAQARQFAAELIAAADLVDGVTA